MTILHLLNSIGYADGCARQVFLLSRECISRGHTVAIVTGANTAPGFFESIGIQVHVAPSLHHQSRSFTGYLRGVRALRRLQAQINPDIAHAHHYYCANQFRHARRRGVPPLIQTMHGLIIEQGRLSFFPAESIILVSTHLRAAYADHIATRARPFTVIPNASDFQVGHDEGADSERMLTIEKMRRHMLTIGFFGRLERMKGIDIIPDALRLLSTRLRFVFLSAGTGSDADAFRFALEDAGISAYHFNEIAGIGPLLRLTDIMILPSYSEGMPLTVLEAGMAAVATVASRVGGIPELIEDHVSGLLIEPGDAHGLAEAIASFAQDDALRRRCADELHRRVTSGYTVRAMTDRTLAVYQAALARARPSV